MGVVTSDRMEKTISVRVDRMVQHPRYKKYLLRHVTFKAHDEKREAREGDLVEIMETRPLSKTKNWRLVRVVERSRAGVETQAMQPAADSAPGSAIPAT